MTVICAKIQMMHNRIMKKEKGQKVGRYTLCPSSISSRLGEWVSENSSVNPDTRRSLGRDSILSDTIALSREAGIPMLEKDDPWRPCDGRGG